MGAPFRTPVDRAALRVRMERAIDRLIAALDLLDAAGEDLEDEFEDCDTSDLEPSLGAPERHHAQVAWCEGAANDCEEGDDSGIADAFGLHEQIDGREPEDGR